jgi:hypothetical protein
MELVQLQEGDSRTRFFDDLNGFVEHRHLRRYQRDIYISGAFTMEDALSGQKIACDTTLLAPHKTFAWRFRFPTREFWLTSSGPNHGYAISAIVNPQSGLIVLAPGADAGIATGFGNYIMANEIARTEQNATALLAGHQNFAHFIWNEMPALLELEAYEPALLSVFTSYEPILPLAELINWPAGVPVRHMAVPDGISEHAGVLFAAGSTLVTAATQARVIRHAKAGRNVALPQHEVRRVWISLRRLYRCAVNELEVFNELIARLGQDARRYEIILDGYSLPHDLLLPGRYDVEWQREQSDLVGRGAAALINSNRSQNVAIIDLTGADLPTAIAWAATADAYICHHGTQQHKIGWLTSIPGLIHVNPHILASQPWGWTAEQAEGAAMPAYVPAALIEDCDSGNERQDNPFFRDYAFKDVGQTAKFMHDFLAEVL